MSQCVCVINKQNKGDLGSPDAAWPDFSDSRCSSARLLLVHLSLRAAECCRASSRPADRPAPARPAESLLQEEEKRKRSVHLSGTLEDGRGGMGEEM